MTPIGSPLEAVTHPDPYPYYAALVAEQPFGFDDGLGLFVAAGAEAVGEVLSAPSGRVRPLAEPVPKGILGTAAGDVFGRLVRMTDGDLHDRLKVVVADALGTLAEGAAWSVAARRAGARLAGGATPDLDALMFAVPSEVVAELCGLVPGAAEDAARLAGEFVKCLSPAATPAQLDEASAAAAALQALMEPQLEGEGAGLLRELVRAAARDDWHERAPLLANGVGFLSQTYDATAGLVGNTLLALRHEPAPDAAAPAELRRFVREVARWDSPVQTTRRFAAEPFEVDGTKVDEGQAVLLLLAAANRDPAVNPQPERFDPAREDPVMFTFGVGGHGCPGETLAVEIACGVVGELQAAGFDPTSLPAEVPYRPSGNVRVPILQQAKEG